MIKWDDTMSVGIWKMDQQHKRWVELINDLSECISQGSSHESLNKLFSNVAEYTRTHFADEEQLLAKNNYPDLDIQRGEHNNFIINLDKLKLQFDSQESGTATDLMNVMCNWLINHIRSCDKKYGVFLAGE